MRRAVPFVLTAVAVLATAPSISAQARAVSASAAPLAPRQMPAGRYDFTSTDDDGDVTAGAVAWSGQQLRIDLEPKERRHRANRGHGGGGVNVSTTTRRGEYMLVDFATNTVRTVKPEEREISELPLATFEQIIGKALGMVGSVVQMQVRDAGILAKELGAGGTVAGLTTKQYRVVEEYNVRIGVFGMSAEEKHHRVVTDYWVPSDASLPRNPLFELLMRSASATAQQDATHQGNVARARMALFAGTPVKATVTVTEAGESPKRATVEITSISTQTPAASLFVLPSGYRIKKNDMNVSL
ncbi:MAG TPA: hypothetical protein VE861_15310 [Gemmatimonadaceae bacterium]|nr:hypothetical protein [Gemmatimonadaceae bacterium]